MTNSQNSSSALLDLNNKLDALLELVARAVPAKPQKPDMQSADAFIWQPMPLGLQPVTNVNRIDISLLCGVDRSKKLLFENTVRFAKGFPANNALLWGARGMGKSSLVKSTHAAINEDLDGYAVKTPLKLIEIHREDIASLPDLMAQLRQEPYRFLIFCDDLSFDGDDTTYKSLKAALDGGIEGRPENVLFYATSNRRHLLPRDMMENERSSAIHPSEAIEEKVSLSDRFGLWLGFHKCSQDEYLDMIKGYVTHFNLKVNEEELRRQALEWSTTRGARSGRVAWQFIQDLAGRLETKL
ncbi:ATP-binding protein [Rhodobacteraceae bacterium RKSG542]|uniref:ATP-binding protein n=1 Tax=Pseudovibrio flavus TaxID=2529854 RepID=UPI0012BCB2A4|nr:ATP-binding protein [Pseudovibrio flavus]MTI15868.1 ATP-binding protein [Pseudovibrio flavus]